MIQIQQNSTDHKAANINQIIEEIEKFSNDSYNVLLKNALTNFFYELEDILTRDDHGSN